MPASPHNDAPFIATSAQVAEDAQIGSGVKIWDLAQVREGATVGAESVIGRGVYVDYGVIVGARCKVQNHAQIYSPAVLGDGVFVGPAAVVTNDRYPRAVSPDTSFKDTNAWTPLGVQIGDGASIGAGAILVGGVTVGTWSVVGAGAVVATDVAAFALVVGSPARRIGWVGRSGHRLEPRGDGRFVDIETGEQYDEHGDTLEIVE